MERAIHTVRTTVRSYANCRLYAVLADSLYRRNELYTVRYCNQSRLVVHLVDLGTRECDPRVPRGAGFARVPLTGPGNSMAHPHSTSRRDESLRFPFVFTGYSMLTSTTQ
jgi:hypothetical protein